jgi:methyl-accepting chemotaxis protein
LVTAFTCRVPIAKSNLVVQWAVLAAFPSGSDMSQPQTDSGLLARMGLRAQMGTLIVAALVAAVVVAGTAYLDARKASRSAQKVFVAKDVTADILPPPMYLVELRLVLSQAAEGSMPPAKAEQELSRLKSEYEARVKYWQDNPPYGLEKDLLGAQHKAALGFLDAASRVVEAVARNADAQAVRAALQTAHAAYLEHRGGVDATVKSSLAFADEAMAYAAAVESATPWKIGGGLLLAGLALAGLGMGVRRSIWRGLGGEPHAAAAVACAVAGGNLATPIPVAPGDTRSLMSQLKRMQDSLSGVVSTVRGNADNVAKASEQITAGNMDLSGRTEQQATALQQTAAAMEQLGSTVGQNADSAQQANQLARGACDVAVKGGEVVAQVVGTMKGINDSSRRISDIIGVIDGIAFQTNILALNAAVEAARAGEQGRGFAVVAGEVRSLAQRSSAAAKEIKDLITASVEQVERGTVLVDQAGTTMQEVVGAIRRVTDIVGEISTASVEQRTGVAQASDAVSHMDSATQHNAALVEQSAAAAKSLAEQAQNLVRAVSVFRLGPQEPTTAT